MTTKVTFTLPAANIIGAAGCVLLGDFNNCNLDEGIYLQKQADGSMTVEVELAAGKEYQFRYLLSNGRWVNGDGEKVISEINGFPVENCIIKVPESSKKNATKKNAGKKSGSTKPAVTAKAKPVQIKEDLTKVEGIGKKIESLLNKNNICSYKQLAKSTISNLKAILESGGSKFSLHNPSSWPKQAKLAADAKWDDLELLQKQLKGGK